MLDFFFEVSDSMAVSAIAAAAAAPMAAGTTLVGLGGVVDTGSSFFVEGGGMTAVLLAGG